MIGLGITRVIGVAVLVNGWLLGDLKAMWGYEET